jgi:exodeoxyribonuclease V alpha subunit
MTPRSSLLRWGSGSAPGDRIATRRNDANLGVANRDTWFVTAVDRDGGLHVTPAREVTPVGVDEFDADRSKTRTLPAGYVTPYVQLGYAGTVHGAQGATVTACPVVIGERTGAASAYVGMTRGRQANTAHLVAADTAEARAQWVGVFARDRADLGPGHAGQRAALEVDRYGLAPTVRPPHLEPRLRAPQLRPTSGVHR